MQIIYIYIYNKSYNHNKSLQKMKKKNAVNNRKNSLIKIYLVKIKNF